MFVTTCVVVAVGGALFSAAAMLKPGLEENPVYRWGGVAGIVVGWGMLGSAAKPALAAAGESAGELALVFFAAGLASLPWIGFAAAFVRWLSGRTATIAMSDNRLKIRPAYDKAEAAEARRDLATAETLYRELAGQHPDDPEPLRRLAELLVKRGDPRAGTGPMEQAIRIEENPNEKFLLSIRLSEILADEARDPAAAAKVLSAVVAALPDNPGVRFAQERLRLLRQRMT